MNPDPVAYLKNWLSAGACVSPPTARQPLTQALAEARQDASAFRASADALRSEAARRAALADTFDAQAKAIEAKLAGAAPR